MKYEPPKTQNKKKRSRKRCEVLWWNPPYSTNIKTRVGAKFLKLIDKHFPKSHPLNKVINRNSVKVSYRNAPNIKKIITAQNSKTIRESRNSEPKKTCNCPKTKICPVQGKCLEENVIYQTKVKTNNSEETYIGLTSNTFKSRLGNHRKAMKNEKYRHDTTLSLHIWELKDRNENFKIDWKIIGQAQPFSPISGICNLCTLEKYHILFNPEQATLNKREEFTNFCLHKRKLLLDKT